MKHTEIKLSYIIILFLLIGLILYSNTLDSPFVFDDLPNITDNQEIQITSLTPEQILSAALGKEKARESASRTLREVREIIGFREF